MKKLLPCRLNMTLLFLTFFVACCATKSSAQVCIKSETRDPFTLQAAEFVRTGGTLIWTTTTFNGTLHEPIRWIIIGDSTGGAYFTNSSNENLGTQTDEIYSGPVNSILVHFGPSAGSVEVRMTYLNNPKASGGSSSGVSLKGKNSDEPNLLTTIETPTVININSITAYPNPYINYFTVDVKTNSNSLLNINIFDMAGKNVERGTFKLNELPNIKFGEGYPIGIYNVIIKQDNETKTLKVIKTQ
jgi:hypothetical protein